MAKVIIEITLNDDSNVTARSTSKNVFTNLGLIKVAEELFVNSIKTQDQSRIIVPEEN